MKITIITLGTRGDVQPYIALALGLKKSGYDVTIAVPTNFKSFVASYGLKYYLLQVDYNDFLNSTEIKSVMAGSKLGAVKYARREAPKLLKRFLDFSYKAIVETDAEAIIYRPITIGCYHTSEKLNIPCFISTLAPILTPNKRFAYLYLPWHNLGGIFNKLSYSFINIAPLFYQCIINKWRKEVLGLPPKWAYTNYLWLNHKRIPILYCYSRHVVPFTDEWGKEDHVTGYWFLDSETDFTPSKELISFLGKGNPPIYIGFGSMTTKDPGHITKIILEALNRTGQRAIMFSGCGGLKKTNSPENVFYIEPIPHDWLFPKVSAVIQHGGAGTTAQSLKAGKPTLICPFIADQPFWGNIASELGVGPKPIPIGKLNADNLSSAINQLVSNEKMRRKAEETGKRIENEDGVNNAIRIINSCLSK
ncbi:glycosyl transferase, related to UDP-glucuronosyltransferase [Candidatus Scalindua japonica]|uniref:Glycosyl transferase, related to UDP-glucuronosyltransferase n=1 Tax=Candidatus Scalindua japonica TaxID=1284222 RepID=A0A286U260_9BACT|nr:glycosyltransferase [Candidatus Scalindua japonica]GAX62216.1 glycosyl transferase, related to UDP-glucuronosyltransferase [Candidatus Scalindua japonica]